jgi:hypothetical protein
MQLGKTTLFSLVELVFSKNKHSPAGLLYEPPADLKNSCFVLRVDFGAVNADREGTKTWEDVGRKFDKSARIKIEGAINAFLDAHDGVAKAFRSTPVASDCNSGDLLEKLARAVETIKPDAVLFVLVDEYDQPMREILLDMLAPEAHPVADNILSTDIRLKSAYPEYTGFFKACKTISSILPHTKTWLTGITPLALPLLSGFIPDVLAFDPDLADVVGLRDEDVDHMLDQVHLYKPFKDNNEKSNVRRAIKRHYNGLKFLSGDGLYHTRLVNTVMDRLSDESRRQQWLQDLSKPMRAVFVEKCPSSVFNVVATAPNLRPVVNKLVTTGEVSGYDLNEELSLSSLLDKDIATDNYLTLLVHLGILSVSEAPSGGFIFKTSSGAYRQQHLDALLDVLRSSLGELFKCKTLKEVYEQGEAHITNFLTTLSATSMSSLIKWAARQGDNHSMELQLQGFIVGELHNELYGIATVQQETVLPTKKRTDITLQGDHVLVILELKKLNGPRPPTDAKKNEYHHQLRDYVTTRNRMKVKGKKRPVAGFIVVLYDDGRHYIVEGLTEI